MPPFPPLSPLLHRRVDDLVVKEDAREEVAQRRIAHLRQRMGIIAVSLPDFGALAAVSTGARATTADARTALKLRRVGLLEDERGGSQVQPVGGLIYVCMYV